MRRRSGDDSKHFPNPAGRPNPDEGGFACRTRALPTRSRSATSWTSSSPRSIPEDRRLDLTQSLDLIFERGHAQGVIDRPIEVVYREVEGLAEGIGQSRDRRVRRTRRRGLPRGVRPVHHRQLRADTSRDRASLRSAGDQRHRIRSLVGTVDVLAADGIAHRRAGLLGRADGQRRVSDRRRAGRALAHRAHLHHQLPRRVRARGDPDRRRADDPPDRAGHHRGGDEAPRGPTRTPSCTAASASVWR